ncbi:MAG: hypothetical protein RIS70_3938 [Planctomycetota bacterium]|jgi:hypothetical protein
MEMGCPSCGQRLNVRDGLKNPTCRCPACQYVFRARDFGYNSRPRPFDPSQSRAAEASRSPFSASSQVVEARRIEETRPVSYGGSVPETSRPYSASMAPSNGPVAARPDPSSGASVPSANPNFPTRSYGPSMPQDRTPKGKKASWGSLLIIALIAAKILSRFWARQGPPPPPPPRNELRAPVPIRRLWGRSERPLFPLEGKGHCPPQSIA